MGEVIQGPWRRQYIPDVTDVLSDEIDRMRQALERLRELHKRGEVLDLGIASDDFPALEAAIKRARSEMADILVTIGGASVGDWLEAHVDDYQLGSRMAFANAYLLAGDKQVARVSGVFLRHPASDAEKRG